MARNTKNEPEFDFAKDMEIDEHSLDTECVRQPGLFTRWARTRAEAEYTAKKAHELVKSIRSKIIMDVATNGIKGNMKPTGPVIEAFYRTRPDYMEAKEDMLAAEYNMAVLIDAVAALRQRKDMLENLVRLKLADYYSTPHTEGATTSEDPEAGARERTRRGKG